VVVACFAPNNPVLCVDVPPKSPPLVEVELEPNSPPPVVDVVVEAAPKRPPPVVSVFAAAVAPPKRPPPVPPVVLLPKRPPLVSAGLAPKRPPPAPKAPVVSEEVASGDFVAAPPKRPPPEFATFPKQLRASLLTGRLPEGAMSDMVSVGLGFRVSKGLSVFLRVGMEGVSDKAPPKRLVVCFPNIYLVINS